MIIIVLSLPLKKKSIINEDLTKDPKEILFSSLEKKLSSKRIIYKGSARTALKVFKIKYIDHNDYDSFKFMPEEYLDNASLYLEKCGLITQEKFANMNLYRFNISSLGSEFCNYLCARQSKSPNYPSL